MPIRVKDGTRGSEHICLNCKHLITIKAESERHDRHFCRAMDQMELSRKVVECSMFDRIKQKGIPLDHFPVWQIHYANDNTPVFIAPGELSDMDYESRLKYIEKKAALTDKKWGKIKDKGSDDNGDELVEIVPARRTRHR